MRRFVSERRIWCWLGVTWIGGAGSPNIAILFDIPDGVLHKEQITPCSLRGIITAFSRQAPSSATAMAFPSLFPSSLTESLMFS